MVRSLFTLIVLLPLIIFAENPFVILELPKARLSQTFLLVGSVGLVLFLVFLFEKMRKRKSDHETDIAMRKTFELKARSSGLTDDEAERLWKMAHLVKSADAPLIFDTVSIFEQGVDRVVGPIVVSPGSHDDRMDTESLIASIRRKLKFNHIDNEHPLVSTRNISPGQIVALFSGRSPLPVIQQARVVANFEFHLRLQYDPAKEQGPVRISRGDKVRISFARQNDGYYEIDMTVAASDAMGWVELHHTMHLDRRQLRKDVRIDAAFPLKFRLVRTPDPTEKERLGAIPQTVKVADISGGGFSFMSDRPLTAEDVLSISFQLPEDVLSGIQARILRISEQQNKEQDLVFYRHHAQYLDIDPAKKEKIVKYVFERLRKNNQWR